MKKPKSRKKPRTPSAPIGSEVLVNVILDRSGSMASNRAGTISGYNEYISGLRADTKTKYSVSLVQFDASSNGPELTNCYIDKPLAEVPELTEAGYEPRGTTPLYDAIGELIRKAEGCANKRPVLSCIITDGMENASREFTKESIKRLISAKEKDGWTFVFVGANIDSFAVGGSMGMAAGATANYATGNERQAFRAIAASGGVYARSLRAGLTARAARAQFFTSEQRAAMGGPVPGRIAKPGAIPRPEPPHVALGGGRPAAAPFRTVNVGGPVPRERRKWAETSQP